MVKYVLIAISLLISCQAHAQEKILKMSCEITPQIWDLKSPPSISSSNNLRRKTGSSEVAQGDFITVEGRVFDENCVPISGATVEIWQVNSLGLDQFNSTDYVNLDSNFIGSGKMITDNLGNFRFLSIFPGSENDVRAPHINFRVKHRDFMPSETEMFFENQINNSKDSNLISQVERSKRQLLIANTNKIGNDYNQEDGIRYNFDIVLEGKNKYKKY